MHQNDLMIPSVLLGAFDVRGLCSLSDFQFWCVVYLW